MCSLLLPNASTGQPVPEHHHQFATGRSVYRSVDSVLATSITFIHAHDQDVSFCDYSEIDVQLVGLVKTLIDPENIMTETAAAVV